VSPRAVAPPTAQDLLDAERVVRAHLAPTPLVAAPGLGARVHLKLESLQPTGSFKVRGALAALAALAALPDPDTEVVTASAGNHGLGIAYAAARLGRRATVVVPEDASPAKVAALRATGVGLVLHGIGYDAAEAHALELAARGAHYVSPYNDPHVIAGQATVAAELHDQLPGPKHVVVPAGGGGLAAGTALRAAQDADGTRVILAEAEQSPAWTNALAHGEVTRIEPGPTYADGLGGNLEAETVTWPIVRDHVGWSAAVTEAEIADAIRFLARAHGLVAEGAAAVGVALLRAREEVRVLGDPVVVVLTGRTIALPTLARILAEE
jgi:threonine dehydratase